MAIFNGKEILLAGLKGDSCFIRYSANADGTDFTETKSEGQNYIGLASGQTAPTDKSGYAWYLLNDPNSIQEIQDLLGNWLLTTDADTITGAIAEHEMDILGLNVSATLHEDRLNALDPRGTASGRCVARLDDVSPYRDGVDVVLSSSSVGAGSEVKVYGKNLLPYPYKATSYGNGITFTDNGDGSVTINGTAEEQCQYLIYPSASPLPLKAGTYTVSGCPKQDTLKCWINTSKGQDQGNGATFTLTEDSSIYLNINVRAGAVIDNLTFYPQIEVGSAPTGFESYKAPVTYTTDAEGKVTIPYIAPTMTLTAVWPHFISAYYAKHTLVEATVAAIAPNVERNESRVSRVEDYLGIESEGKLITVEGTNETVPVPEVAFPKALLVEIHGQQALGTPTEHGYNSFVPNYPSKVTRDDGTVLFEMPPDVVRELDDFGYEENYIYFDDDGKAWYHQAAKVEAYQYTPTDGETIIDEVYDGGRLVRMVSPIITDISNHIAFDGVINVKDCSQIIVEMYVPNSDEVTDWGIGKTKFIFQV